MKLLRLHNFYRQLGGEDASARTEEEVLAGFGPILPCQGFVRFSQSQIRLAAQYCLQLLGLDGQLRFIAIHGGGGQ